MIGLIQHTLLVLLEKEGGTALKQRILTDCGLDPETYFPIHQDFSDTECAALITAAAMNMRVDEQTLWGLYADHFLEEAKAIFPRFFELAPSARDFLLRQPTIHCAFGAGLRDPQAREQVRDKFQITEDGGDLIVRYRSHLQLCQLYGALAERVLRLYDQPGSVEELQCRHQGHEACTFHISFNRDTGKAAAQ
ncbi:heme NO-binding domain-containing protein [Aquisalimonas asiatica]|uniref:Haem-NO-binding n=1 Tax=Aquisalimonas asiatica TaxID=406100 RepID=A0A1H8PLN1_9GAMM|nr:heme NO-binding domain-containing protein [Aquisalimonas asiatica]SEO42443.1 Haem-NO-binding [Aquisalimonas asiatica]